MLAVSLVVARATSIETLRDSFGGTAAPDAAPAGPGAASSLVLDALCFVPALLVLARRCADRAYVVRWTWGHVLFAAFAGWAMLSATWAGDKFAAVVAAGHLLAAAALMWAATQLVRTWPRLRIVAGACYGLLLVYVAHGAIYELIDVPENARYWREHKQQFLADHGWVPNSYAARQFERKLLAGDIIGFGSSPNTYAAVVVLLGVAAAGVVVQRVANRDRPAWAVLGAAGLPPAALMLYLTHSKTALATPILAAAVLLAVAWLQPRMAARHARAYVAGVGGAVLVGLAVVGHGLYHHALPTASLAFRWRYWTASARMFAAHWAHGVGWANFGQPYLAFRDPAAAEEIKDPHNFIVRAAAELGIVGGTLIVGWLLRFWWEATRPMVPASAAAAKDDASRRAPPGAGALWLLAAVAGLGTLGAVVLNIDPAQDWGYVLVEACKRLLYLGLLFLGFVIAALRSQDRPEIDSRPAPWVLYGVVAGIAAFLVHNLVDFSLFEPGPLTAFALLAGAVTGVRLPSAAGRRRRTSIAVAATAALAAGWCALVLTLVIPVADAEAKAADADAQVRAHRPDLAAGLLRAALREVPYNADYAYRTFEADRAAGAPPDAARGDLANAVALDPTHAGYRLMQGQYEASLALSDAVGMRLAFDAALRLDPANVAARLSYAAALAAAGDEAAAMAQYGEALQSSAMLGPPAAEPKRDDLVIRQAYAETLARFRHPAEAAAQLRAGLAFADVLAPDDYRRPAPEQRAAIEKRIAELATAPPEAPERR